MEITAFKQTATTPLTLGSDVNQAKQNVKPFNLLQALSDWRGVLKFHGMN